MFPFPIILASKSPRRQELLQLMDIDFKVLLKEVDESYPDNLNPHEVACYIAKKKARAFDEDITDELVITADTVVIVDDQILGKPESPEQAKEMLRLLSGRKHQVITGVCLLYKHQLISFDDLTAVHFRELTEEEINFYVEKYNPMDKAGAYGIQEWIGLTAITKLEGSYTNVMGLPTEKLYRELLTLH